MSKQNVAQEILDFNKNAVKESFEALNTISNQAAKAANQILDATPNVPEEGKKAVNMFFKENEKGLSSQRKFVESGLEIDWTSPNASAKGLEAIETLYNSAFSQVDSLQKETSELLKKATEQLPKEAKPVVDFWNGTLNSNYQSFQNFVTQNFALARKVMGDLAAEAPKADKKAATK
ncbi:MAG: hypothetical protein PHI31_07695 [Desulfuromonadaceae bacterium]|nr:hypothetical protein [Desulfuromonadaceae bacterium]